MVQWKRKTNKKHINALCNLKENIILGLTNIKVIREIGQDLSKPTIFRKYTRRENAFESADDLEEGKNVLLTNPLSPWERKSHEKRSFLFSPHYPMCRKVRSVSICSKEWKRWKKVHTFRYVNKTFPRNLIWKLQSLMWYIDKTILSDFRLKALSFTKK